MVSNVNMFSGRTAVKGLSLFEVALFMLACGLMLAAGSPIYQAYLNQKNITTTTNNVALAQQALTTFYQMNGRLPCPAARNAPLDSANSLGFVFGQEVSGASACKDNGAGAGGAQAGDGTVSVAGRVLPGGSNNWMVRIGALPVRSLGLPDSVAYDAWGHLMNYAVTELYASTTIGTPPKDLLHGAVTLYDSAGNNITDPKNGPTGYGMAVFAVVAPGPNGQGYYTAAGAQQGSCPTSGLAHQNCSDTGKFVTTMQTSYSSGSNALSFTNTVAYKAFTCTAGHGGSGGGNFINLTFLIDTSETMEGTGDNVVMNGHVVSADSAAKGVLETLVPQVVSYQSANNPTGVLAVGSLNLYCNSSVSGQSKCATNQAHEQSAAVAAGMSSSITMHPSTLPSTTAPTSTDADKLFSGFTVADVGDGLSNASTATFPSSPANIPAADYTAANTTLTAQMNGIFNAAATGIGTPLYQDTVSIAAGMNASQDAAKPNEIVIFTDGLDNDSNITNVQMITDITTNFPNTRIFFVYVGDASGASAVQNAYFGTAGTNGKKLQGTFVPIQDYNGILGALQNEILPSCPMP